MSLSILDSLSITDSFNGIYIRTMDVQKLSLFSALLGKISFKRLSKPEELFTAEVANYLKGLVLDGYPIIFFHVPNESWTSINYSLKLNSMGRISGAPDFVVCINGKCLLLELKAQKGKQSEKQKMFQQWATIANTTYLLINNIEPLKDYIKKELHEGAPYE